MTASADGLPEQKYYDNDGYICEQGVRPKFVLKEDHDALRQRAEEMWDCYKLLHYSEQKWKQRAEQAESLLTAERQKNEGWRPFPAEKPEPDKDARHLVVITQGDMHWIGIRYWNHQYGYWQGQTSRDSDGNWSEYVYWFKPLLAGGECPSVPNSAEQVNDPTTHELAEARRVR